MKGGTTLGYGLRLSSASGLLIKRLNYLLDGTKMQVSLFFFGAYVCVCVLLVFFLQMINVFSVLVIVYMS